MLLWAQGSVPIWVVIIPTLWLAIGGQAAFLLGVPHDWMLLVGGLAATAIQLRAAWRHQKSTRLILKSLVPSGVLYHPPHKGAMAAVRAIAVAPQRVALMVGFHTPAPPAPTPTTLSSARNAVRIRRGPPTTTRLNLSFDCTGALVSVGKDGGLDGDHQGG